MQEKFGYIRGTELFSAAFTGKELETCGFCLRKEVSGNDWNTSKNLFRYFAVFPAYSPCYTVENVL